jgi:hypothetical protein
MSRHVLGSDSLQARPQAIAVAYDGGRTETDRRLSMVKRSRAAAPPFAVAIWIGLALLRLSATSVAAQGRVASNALVGRRRAHEHGDPVQARRAHAAPARTATPAHSPR